MPRIKEIAYLNPRDLEPDPQNARTDIGDIIGLAETIREHGVLQPLGVTPVDGGYRVVYGNRRREAAIVVGLDRVPCLVLDEQPEADRLTCQLLENLQRKALNDLEQGRALLHLRQQVAAKSPPGTSETALNELVAKRLGLSPRTVQRYISLCALPESVQHLILADELTVTQAQHLHALGSEERQVEVAQLAVEMNLSAVELSRLCSSLARNPNIAAAEALLRLRRGEEVAATRPAANEEPMTAPPLRAASQAESEPDDEFWPGEEAEEASEAAHNAFPPDSVTADGNRRFRIHSFDSFMDEVARLSRCAEEGDLEKLVKADPAAQMKIGLALKQLAYVSRQLEALARHL